MSDTPYLDALSRTCDNAERWIASRMLVPDDDAALARTRDLLALLRGLMHKDVALLHAAADWSHHDGTDGTCPQCDAAHWKISYPPHCVGCGYHMPRRPDPDDLRNLADRLAYLESLCIPVP